MALIVGSAQVPGNSTVPVFTTPPGYCNITVYQPSQPQQVFVGTSNRVSTTSGMLLTPTPVGFETFVGSSGTTWFATTGNATAATFSYMISSTN